MYALDQYLACDAKVKATSLFSLLSEDGILQEGFDLDQESLLRMYRGMRRLRILDERMLILQRQGRIGFYGEARGQEAAVIGTASALCEKDWIVPALREAGVGLYCGMPLSIYINQIFGNAADVSKGRQMPCHPCDKDHNYVVMSSCVANQLPHAVGIAWAMKHNKDTDRLCVSYMGDGGTSEGSFHIGLNFAQTMSVPVLFICQNNGWAISTPTNKQTISETYAIKGLAYDMESLRVDGNDLLAVSTLTKYAAEKIRKDQKPIFIEAVTYRVSAHSSSDDPSRYRDESVTKEWIEKRDPIDRIRKLLFEKKWMTEDEDQKITHHFESEINQEIKKAEAIELPDKKTLTQDVFEEEQ